MANEGLGGMIATSRLIYAAEREEGRIAGEREGKREGKIEGTQNTLAQMISFRFPTASPSFVKKVSRPTDDSYVNALMSVVFATSSLDEFKKKVKTLKPAC